MTWLINLLAQLFHWDTTPVPIMDTSPTPAPVVPADTYRFDTPQDSFHSVRVLCDNAGLTYAQKNVICACIFQESRFYNGATHQNKNDAGVVLSTDWGICQVNDWYHIGVRKDFPSVQYVLDNPDKVVEWMIGMYKHGLLKQWVSYSSNAYQQWLVPTSPMWALKTNNPS